MFQAPSRRSTIRALCLDPLAFRAHAVVAMITDTANVAVGRKNWVITICFGIKNLLHQFRPLTSCGGNHQMVIKFIV